MNTYDAIVVGAGLGGGIAAAVLAEAGQRVLVLEQGIERGNDEVATDHLRNHRISLYGDNTSMNPRNHPRVGTDRQGTRRTLLPHENGYELNAFTVGGGARVWGMQAWRFHPDDFRMAARYGVPAGSSLADWPICYDDLAPFYEKAEWEIGVAGNNSSSLHTGREREYPLPPVRLHASGQWLREGAQRLGWGTVTPPLAVNTVARDGRGACIECGQCIGFSCPTDAKNGSHNSVLRRARANGQVDLVTCAQAGKLLTNGRGKVNGVEYVIRDSARGIRKRQQAFARIIVLAAGAIETARLLLLSSSAHHPRGIGNDFDHVGRHLQGHRYPTAYGLLPPGMRKENFGPGVCVATTRFNHGNPDIIGGGMLANDFVTLPIIFWRSNLPPEIPRWGLANKKAMRDLYLRGVDVRGPVQEIPHSESRVTLDNSVQDTAGLPVAHLSGTVHAETLRTADFMRNRAEEWLRASGAEKVWSYPSVSRLSAGQHQAGTCRMSEGPRDGVTDPAGRVHGHDNLFICDGSVHVTNGGFNPALTIMALAFRTAAFAANAAK